MRILLRHTTSELYFQSPEKWTADPEMAVDFRFMDRAIRFVETWGLKGVELAFADDPAHQIRTLPLEPTALQPARA